MAMEAPSDVLLNKPIVVTEKKNLFDFGDEPIIQCN